MVNPTKTGNEFLFVVSKRATRLNLKATLKSSLLFVGVGRTKSER
jgi:hypothetical protein